MHFNIADLYESVTDVVPDRTALVSGSSRFTFAELDMRANRLAHALADRGLKAGQHLGLYLYNGEEYMIAMLAAFKLRAVPINVNYRYVAEELKYLVHDGDLTMLFAESDLAAEVSGALAEKTPVTTVVWTEAGNSGRPAPAIAGVESGWFRDFAAHDNGGRDFEERSDDDLYIVYTGGTTGMPKGVMWRQADIFYAGLQGGRPGDDPVSHPSEVAAHIAAGNTSPSCISPAAPLIHGAAQFASWIALMTGGKVVLTPGRSFDAALTLESISREAVGVLNLVGDAMARPFAEMLEANPGKYDLSNLYVVTSAGAVLSEHVKQKLKKLLPYTMILNNFGASETGHQGTALDTGEGGPVKFFMLGDNTAVLDEDMQPIAPGDPRIGKLARTGHIPLGYYKAPEKTAATFVHDKEGRRWVIPGDFATIDEEGIITLLGRGAVCINTGGEKVFPEEVEEALKGHPAIYDAVVVGVADARWGERVTALLKLRDGVTVTPDEVIAHCRTKVAGYKVPREVWFVASMERHPSGKPDYRWAKTTATALANP